MRALIVLAACAGLSACATSRVTAYKDAAAASANYSSVVVLPVGAPLEQRADLEAALCKRMVVRRCISGLTLFPPTRTYTDQESKEIVARAGGDAVLVVQQGTDQSATYVAGYTSYSNFSGDAATTFTAPMAIPSRRALSVVSLMDAASGKVIWSGEVSTKGDGFLNVTDSAFASATAKEIAEALTQAGLVR